MTSENKKPIKTSIGGQAVMEGVMMRGVDCSAMAVRVPDGSITVEKWDQKPMNSVWYKRTPFIRGIFNMIDSLLVGYRCLMRSAELSGLEDEEEPSPFEKKVMEKLGENFMKVFSVISLILGMGIAILLFMVLPTFLGRGIQYLWTQAGWGVLSQIGLSLIEGVAKIIIFVLYLALVSRMKEIKRLFGYHGAEHQSIACYEAREELTVENVRKHSRFHPRCGTSFLLIVLIISILVSSPIVWTNPLIRIVCKIALLPVVVGIAYEIIKLAGRHDNWLTRAVSAPGLWLQRLTTNPPDDSMIETAIAALTAVLPKEEGSDKW